MAYLAPVSEMRFLLEHVLGAGRLAETERFAAWFADRGATVERLPDDLSHEGAGDALPFGADTSPGAPVLLSGYRFRSDAAASPRSSMPAWSRSGCAT